MIQPQFITVGSIVEYNGMISDVVGIIPPRPDKSKRFNNVWVVELGIGVICPLSDIRPIALTEKILTEWCGFVNKGNDEFMFRDEESRMVLEFTELYLKCGRGVFYSNYPVLEPHTCIANIEYLHQLQHLYSALTQTFLPIQIK